MIIIHLLTVSGLIVFIIFSILIYNKIYALFKNMPEYNVESNISIVIAVKNEAKNIPTLISSLAGLDYPAHKLELIIIDDDSEDETIDVIKQASRLLPDCSFFTVQQKKYIGKKGAVNAGIEKAKYPFIFITDADCKIEPDILKSVSYKFNNGCDFIFGPSPFFEEKFFINRMSCFENLRSSMLIFSAAGYGIPYCAAARNFAFKKSAFEKLHGFDQISGLLSGDDDLLLQLAVKNNLKIDIITDKLSFVYSSTKKTFKEYFSQRARHTQASFYYLPSRKILLTLWHSINLFLLFSPALIILNELFILPFIIKILFDIILVSRLQNKFAYEFKFYEIVLFQIIYEIMLLINLFNARFGKIKWK